MKIGNIELSMIKPLTALLAQQIATGIIFLHGDLGSGKTTFVQNWLLSLGYKGKIKSPTYTIVESYYLKKTIYHFDLYRLNSIEEWDDLGGRDYLYDNTLIFVEWPEKAKPLLPKPDLDIYINYKIDSLRDFWFFPHTLSTTKIIENISEIHTETLYLSLKHDNVNILL